MKKVRSAVCKTLIAEGILKIFVRFWDECHKNPKKFYSNVESVEFQNMHTLNLILQNYSDLSKETASAYFENGDVILHIVQVLNMLKPSVPILPSQAKLQKMIDANLAILLNAVRNDNRNRIHIRQNKGVKTIFAYAKSEIPIIKAVAFIVLAYCVNEEENTNLADCGVVAFIVKMLNSAVSSPDHHGGIGTAMFSAEELTDALHKLASDGENKKSMVEEGVLPLLTQLLKDNDSSEDEHLKCINCLWSLAYDKENCMKIINERGLIEGIKLRKTGGSSKELTNAIEGLMFVLGAEQSVSTASIVKQKQIGNQSTVKQKHIMISYNWEVKPVVRKLKEFLKSKGQSVWIDDDNLHGNIIDGMAEAIENSALVVAAITQSYKDSNNCRQEFQYAHDRNIPILPLLLQPGYKADGWLGFLVAKEKYVDLSSPDNMPNKFMEIFIEVRTLLKDNCQADGQTTSVQLSVTTTTDSGMELVKAVLPCQKWSEMEVQSWCSEIGIKDLKNYDGEDLSELCKVMVRCPEEYYRVLRDDLNLEFKDKNKLSKALASFL